MKPPTTLPAAASSPRMSSWLTDSVRHLLTAHPGTPPLALRPSVRDEARRVLPHAEAQALPADADAWRRFLLPLLAVVRQAPSREAFNDFCAIAARSLTTIPAILLTPNRQGEACRRFAWFPAVADLAEWLEPEARETRGTALALRRIADQPEAAAPPAISYEQRAEMTARFAALREELEGGLRVAEAERPTARAAPLRSDLLIEAYRRQAEGEGPSADLARVRLAAMDPEGDWS